MTQFRAIPSFGISDYKKALEFYVGFLGFNIDWEHRFSEDAPVYTQISLRGLILHLSENQRFAQAQIVFVETRDLIQFHHELSGRKGVLDLPPVTETQWGTNQLELYDPFGNLLRFNESLN